MHLGHGPEGGELVLVVPAADTVALGDLAGGDTDRRHGRVGGAIDLAIGLTRPSSQILTSSGAITRDELEDFHQRLLGVLHG